MNFDKMRITKWQKQKHLLKLSMLFLFLWLPMGCSTNSNTYLTYAKMYQYPSLILHKKRQYSVHLPEGYSENLTQHYPVLYVLDADRYLLSVLAIIQSLRQGFTPLIPATIVVGVYSPQRMRDYTPSHTQVLPNGEDAGRHYQNTGGGLAFIEYLEKELKTEIANRYRTNNSHILIGHSLGGLLALAAIKQHKNIFNGYLVIDASLWFDYPKNANSIWQTLNTTLTTPTSLYLAIANQPYTPSLGRSYFHRDTLLHFAQQISAKPQENLIFKSQYLQHTNHYSIYPEAVRNGLQWLFKEYPLKLDQHHFSANQTILDYQTLNTRTGAKLKPDKAMLKRLIKKSKRWQNMQLPQQEIIKLLVHYYPKTKDKKVKPAP